MARDFDRGVTIDTDNASACIGIQGVRHRGVKCGEGLDVSFTQVKEKTLTPSEKAISYQLSAKNKEAKAKFKIHITPGERGRVGDTAKRYQLAIAAPV